MRKFIVKVNNQQFEVELEEVRNVNTTNSVKPSPAEKVAKPSSNGNGSSSVAPGKGESVLAPMPGNIIKINVNKGDTVKHGQVLLVLEAMKMENEITAPCSGTIGDVFVTEGKAVNNGDALLTIK